REPPAPPPTTTRANSCAAVSGMRAPPASGASLSVIGRGAVQSKKAPDGYRIRIRHAQAFWRPAEYPRMWASQERGTLMPTGAPRHVRKGARWEDAYARCRSVAPEAFDHDR